MDEDQARAALTEVERRRGEVTQLAARESTPAWFVIAAITVVLAMSLVSDLRLQDPAWNGWFTRWVVPLLGMGLMTSLALVLYRRASVTVHRSVRGRHTVALLVGFAAFYVVTMAIGMPMRYYDVPWDQTVSTVGAALLVAAGWLVWRAVEKRRAPGR